MFFSSSVYTIDIGAYAERHYISDFRKAYKKAWDITRDAVEAELKRLDNFLNTTKAEIINSCREGEIIKCEFTIAGSGISPHASGNRYIVFHNTKIHKITVLLVYGKTHIRKGQHETIWWKQEIKNNYADIKKYFPTL